MECCLNLQGPVPAHVDDGMAMLYGMVLISPWHHFAVTCCLITRKLHAKTRLYVIYNKLQISTIPTAYASHGILRQSLTTGTNPAYSHLEVGFRGHSDAVQS